MDSLQKKKAQRYLYLKRLYKLTDGDTVKSFERKKIGGELGWDEATTHNVAFYLKDEGLIRYQTFTKISITHRGVKQIEKAQSYPDQPTNYFPPPQIIIFAPNGDITIGGDVIGRDKTVTT